MGWARRTYHDGAWAREVSDEALAARLLRQLRQRARLLQALAEQVGRQDHQDARAPPARMPGRACRQDTLSFHSHNPRSKGEVKRVPAALCDAIGACAIAPQQGSEPRFVCVVAPARAPRAVQRRGVRVEEERLEVGWAVEVRARRPNRSPRTLPTPSPRRDQLSFQSSGSSGWAGGGCGWLLRVAF